MYKGVIQNEVRATGGWSFWHTSSHRTWMEFRNDLNDVLSLFHSLSPPPHPPSLPAGGVLLSKTHTSSDTWLTAGGRRDAGERRADTDTHSNQPSVVRLPQLCSCVLQLHQSTSAEWEGIFVAAGGRSSAREMRRPFPARIRPLGLLLLRTDWYPSWIFCWRFPPWLSLAANELLLDRKRTRCLWRDKEPYSCY